MDVRIVLPERSQEALSNALRDLTAEVAKARPDIERGYGLGGEHGYGLDIDTPVFQMHHYCWCERDDCAWCMGCDCPESAFHYFADGAEVTYDEWMAFYHREMGERPEYDDPAYQSWIAKADAVNERRQTRHDATCGFCLGRRGLKYGATAGRSAPHFWHKPSGFRVWWYKWIGRGMEVNQRPPSDLAALIQECIASVPTVSSTEKAE